jgi:hypothetical protein
MEGFPLKLLEGLVLLGALVAFAWWQLRDVARAREKTRVEANRDAADRPAASEEPPR